MFTYMKYKEDFIKDFEEESIVKWLTGERKGSRTEEIISWRNSIPYLYAVLRDERISDRVLVGLEYEIDNNLNNRVDVMIGGYNKRGRRTIIIIEMKQWSDIKCTKNRIRNRFNCDIINPSLQVLSYCYQIENMINNPDTFDFVPVVYFHNQLKEECEKTLFDLMEPYRTNTQLKSLLDLWRNDKKTKPQTQDYLDGIMSDNKKMTRFSRRYYNYQQVLFFAGQIRELSSYIADILGGTDNTYLKKNKNDTFSELRKGQYYTNYKLHKYVPRCLNKSIPMDYTFSGNQKKCYENITKIVTDFLKGKKVSPLYIKGGPGSGKSVIAFMLLQEYASIASYYVPNKSVVNSYKNANINYIPDKNDIGTIFTQRTGTKRIVIIDELHRVKKDVFDEICKQNTRKDVLLIAFYDPKQRISRKDADLTAIKNMDPELKTQYRCCRDEGYVTWLEKIFEMYEVTPNINNYSFKKCDLDFNVEIIKSEQELKDKIEKRNNTLLVGPYFELKTRDRVGRLKISKWEPASPKKKSFIDNHWNNKTNYAGKVFDIQGIETDNIIVIIGPELRYSSQCGVYLDLDCETASALFGLRSKKGINDHKEELRTLIMNTYRVLLTRGLKNCYIYCCDKGLTTRLLNS
ncbi:MAG: DUF2075 domain-containing protein [Lachnospiraceae bacterium]|nr:DUF2075 domain-containing protein [Lachnospiraceae bacterium]